MKTNLQPMFIDDGNDNQTVNDSTSRTLDNEPALPHVHDDIRVTGFLTRAISLMNELNASRRQIPSGQNFVIDNRTKLLDDLFELIPDKYKSGQHDAEEFLVYFLEAYNSACGVRCKEKFEISIEERFTCASCNEPRNPKVRTCRILQLALCPTVSESIEKELQEEVRDDFRCACCDIAGHVTSRKEVKSFPACVIISLNRWDASFEKKLDNITFEKTIRIGEKEYCLKSILLHRGGMATDGHYRCIFHHEIIGGEIWYCANDTMCGAIDDPTLSTNAEDPMEAYILIYQKKEISITGTILISRHSNRKLRSTSKRNVANGLHNFGETCFMNAMLQGMSFNFVSENYNSDLGFVDGSNAETNDSSSMKSDRNFCTDDS